MNTLEKRLLQRFCEEHGLDYQLIDDTLTYDENKKQLMAMVGLSGQKVDYEEWWESLPLNEIYGVSGTPTLLFTAYVKLRAIDISSCGGFRVRKPNYRLYTQRFSKHIKLMGLGYAQIRGDINTITAIIQYLERQDLRLRLIKLKTDKAFDESHIP